METAPPIPMPEALSLELAVCRDPYEATEAFLKAVTVAALFYGLSGADVVLPEAAAVAPGALEAVAADALALAKAIPTHPAHYQPRVAGGQFTRLHPGNYNPRDAQGKFRQRLDAAERQAALAEAGEYVAQFHDRLQDHLSDYQRRPGGLPGPDFLQRCERDIRLFYGEVYRRGKQTVGDPAVKLSPQDKAALNRLVKDEMEYLVGFEAALAAGKTSPQWPPQKRMALYARAAWEAFWMGWILGDQRKDRELRWAFGNTIEHCRDCARFEALGWTGVRDFVREILAAGYAPRSGQLECHGVHCDCRLEERLNGVLQPPVQYPTLGN